MCPGASLPSYYGESPWLTQPQGARGGCLALPGVDLRPHRRSAAADTAVVAGRQSGRAPGAGSELRGDLPHPAHPVTGPTSRGSRRAFLGGATRCFLAELPGRGRRPHRTVEQTRAQGILASKRWRVRQSTRSWSPPSWSARLMGSPRQRSRGMMSDRWSSRSPQPVPPSPFILGATAPRPKTAASGSWRPLELARTHPWPHETSGAPPHWRRGRALPAGAGSSGTGRAARARTAT